MHKQGLGRGRRMAITAGLLLSAMLLAGCAGTRPAQVTTFHQPGVSAQDWQGRRFAVAPLPGQADSLAYASYAGMVRQALQKHGLQPVGSLNEAELAVSFLYGSVEGGDVEGSGRSVSSGLSFGFGGGSSVGWGVGFGIPIGGTGAAEALYRHQLQVRIHRVRPAVAGSPAAPGERLYESTLVTSSTAASIAPRMPVMIEALFAGFPGENGQTRTIQLPAETAGTR